MQYLTNQTNKGEYLKIRNLKTVDKLLITDLDAIAEDTSVSIILWDEEVVLCGGIYFYKDNKQIAPFFDTIKELLIWFAKRKIGIVQSVTNQYLEIAQELNEEKNIKADILYDDILNNIEIVEIGFCIGDIEDEPEINIYLDCGEYFTDHVICCYLKKENDKIECNFSLEG